MKTDSQAGEGRGDGRGSRVSNGVALTTVDKCPGWRIRYFGVTSALLSRRHGIRIASSILATARHMTPVVSRGPLIPASA